MTQSIMNNYLVRVILHGKHYDHSDFNILFSAMKEAGYSNLIKGESNERHTGVWKLPPAEYHICSADEISSIRQAVKTIANSVDSNNAVFVTDYFHAAWDGLKSS